MLKKIKNFLKYKIFGPVYFKFTSDDKWFEKFKSNIDKISKDRFGLAKLIQLQAEFQTHKIIEEPDGTFSFDEEGIGSYQKEESDIVV